MATKYVTLKDSNGDTLYPQAVATNLAPGGIGTTELADSAVTAGKIANGAVTSAKIDWTTVTSSSVALSDLVSASTGYTITGTANKTGNLLVANLIVTKTSGSFGSGQVIVGNIKTGYRPKSTWNFMAVLGASEWAVQGACYCYINSGGDIYINNQAGITNCQTVKILAVWFTA